MRGKANAQGGGGGGAGRTAANPPKTKRAASSRGRQLEGALLHCWLRGRPYLMLSCSHRVVRNTVLGNGTCDSSGILSYTHTVPILTNYLRVIPTRETCTICYHSFLLRSRLELGLN